jgi:hypothetical protein
MTKTIINVQTGEVTTEEYTAEELVEIQSNRDNLPNEQMAEIRMKRNLLLAETDWMANSDVTMSDEWRAYRQALRDLPANTTDPANPVWPTKPE